MRRYLIKIDGPDSPGIVAAVTAPIASVDCNLEDTSMTRVGGYFAMLLIVTSPHDSDVDVLHALFEDAAQELSLKISIEALPEEPTSPTRRLLGDVWALTLSGSDTPGVVSAFSQYLASIGANIEDLSTRMVGASSGAYAVLIDVVVPKAVPSDRFVGELNALAQQYGVQCDARLVGTR